MINSVSELKKQRPDLVKLFENMNRKQLLKQIYKECLDGINMQTRVELFMQECTSGMSKTTYTEESLKTLIEEKQDQDISDWCKMTVEDSNGDDAEIIKEVKEKAKTGY